MNNNKKRILSISFILFLIIGTISLASTVSAAPIYVDSSTGNDVNNGLYNITPVKTINNGISKVGSNEIIYLNGTFTGNVNINITVDKNINIRSYNKNQPAVIDGLGTGFFYICLMELHIP